MGNRDLEDVIGRVFYKYILADKLLVGIAQQCTRQQAGFAEDLETDTNAKYLSAVIGKFYHTLHHRAEPGDRPATEIITIRKAVGQNDTIFDNELADILVLMPEHGHILTKIMLQCIKHIPVTIGPRENDNAKFHL